MSMSAGERRLLGRLDTGPLDVGPAIPMDKDRAAAILQHHVLDGMIALQPFNVYYMTNTVPVLNAFNAEISALAVFGAQQLQTFYVGSVGSLWDTTRGNREVPDAIPFSMVANAEDYIGAPPAQLHNRPQAWAGQSPISPTAALSPTETAWRGLQQRYNASAEASREWALAKAIGEAGLTNKRIAVDDMRIAGLLNRIGFDQVTIVPGEDIFRHIRLIKSDYEIEMLRLAQLATQNAVNAAVAQLEPGMRYQDFE